MRKINKKMKTLLSKLPPKKKAKKKVRSSRRQHLLAPTRKAKPVGHLERVLRPSLKMAKKRSAKRSRP